MTESERAELIGAVEVQRHLAEQRQTRIEVLEREALANARTTLEAIEAKTTWHLLRDRVRVLEEANLELANLNRATLHAAGSRIPAPTVTESGGDLFVNGTYICRATSPHLVVNRLRKALGLPEVTT